PVVLIFRVDPETKLPRSMRVAGNEPKETVEFALDYPERGPADIYALGVPQKAKVVDRVPAADLTRCLDGLQAGRQRFESYQALIVESLVQKDNTEQILMLTLVWRDGKRWRMERGVSKAGWGIAPPKEWPEQNADVTAWLKEYAASLRFVPWIVCDG